MKLEGKVVVVTGGANGIGSALSRRFAAEGAAGVVVADMDVAGAEKVAAEIGGLAVKTDVSRDVDVQGLVEQATAAYGRIDLFCSNAGIGGFVGGTEVPNDEWQRIWEINVMAHVYAARAVLPAMLARGEGYLLQTVSAAGLLTQIGSAPYSVTKHAAMAFAEWLSITYGDAGITVSALCPQGVRTRMLGEFDHRATDFLRETAISSVATHSSASCKPAPFQDLGGLASAPSTIRCAGLCWSREPGSSLRRDSRRTLQPAPGRCGRNRPAPAPDHRL